MCGIVGYLGKLKATDVILSGLEKLEYRGYDSCGIFFHDSVNDSFVTYKDKGRVQHLLQDFDYDFENHLGIGHTRWATHGKPNRETPIHIFHILNVSLLFITESSKIIRN